MERGFGCRLFVALIFSSRCRSDHSSVDNLHCFSIRLHGNVNPHPCFPRLRESSWRIMDASRTIPEIESDLLAVATEVIQECGQKPLTSLWTNISFSAPTNKDRVSDKENLDVSPNKKGKTQLVD